MQGDQNLGSKSTILPLDSFYCEHDCFLFCCCQVFLCFIFGSILGCALSAEGDSNARLLISKHILNQFAVEGKELTVHYNIYNVGSG